MKPWNVICTRPHVRPSQGVWGSRVTGACPVSGSSLARDLTLGHVPVWFLDSLSQTWTDGQRQHSKPDVEIRGRGTSLI